MATAQNRTTIPPVMVVRVEDTMDVMLARNTARRAASLLGFSSASRAQIATAVATLTDIILNMEARQQIHLHGIREGVKTGIQIASDASWIAAATHDNALVALRSKLGEMVDEIDLEQGNPPKIKLVLWLSDERAAERTS